MDLTTLEIANNLAKEIDFLEKHLKRAYTMRENALFCTFKACCSIVADDDFELVIECTNEEKVDFATSYIERIKERLEKCKKEFSNL